jgi:hypothetical protein
LASLDHIDDDDGYTKVNVRFLDIRLQIRRKWTVEKWAQFCGEHWQDFLIEREQEMLGKKGEEMDGRTLDEKLRDLSQCAKGRSLEQIKRKWVEQGGRCAYSNIHMGWGNCDLCDWCVSVERISKGLYDGENVVLVCAEFNSPEYHTERFEDQMTEAQGWSPGIVNKYRSGFYLRGTIQ